MCLQYITSFYYVKKSSSHLWSALEAHALQWKFRLCIPFLGIARPQSQFPRSCVCDRFIYSQVLSTYCLQQNRQIDRENTVYKSLTDTLGLWPRNSFSGSICFELSTLFLCSVEHKSFTYLYVWILRNYRVANSNLNLAVCFTRFHGFSTLRVFLCSL